MDKSKKSQILKLFLIASLFLITPLIPTIVRSTYLYLIFNILVVSLGAEAGLASFFYTSGEDKKHVNTKVTTPTPVIQGGDSNTQESKEIVKPEVLVEKRLAEKIVVEAVRVVNKMKKCPSRPCIFFIGNCESEPEESVIDQLEDEEEEEEEEEDNGQELFSKAEMFIGNFYTQLKMQRQDSWNRIHGIYQKAL